MVVAQCQRMEESNGRGFERRRHLRFFFSSDLLKSPLKLTQIVLLWNNTRVSTREMFRFLPCTWGSFVWIELNEFKTNLSFAPGPASILRACGPGLHSEVEGVRGLQDQGRDGHWREPAQGRRPEVTVILFLPPRTVLLNSFRQLELFWLSGIICFGK